MAELIRVGRMIETDSSFLFFVSYRNSSKEVKRTRWIYLGSNYSFWNSRVIPGEVRDLNLSSIPQIASDVIS
jgi:hypothetical protein